MASLSTGSSATLVLDYDDVVNFSGTANVTVQNQTTGTVTTQYASGASAFGPFKALTLITITAISACTYTQSIALGVQPSTLLLSQSAIPVILPSSGSITNGVLSGLTSLPVAYGSAWMYFPAGAGLPSGAGLYFVTGVTTGGGNITTSYQSAASAFTPYIPANPVLITSGGSAYTQTTGSDITLANITVPGGLMGANGVLRNTVSISNNNSAGSKALAVKLAGSFENSVSITTTVASQTQCNIRNRGVQNSQISTSAASSFAPSGAPTLFTAVNTAQDQPLTFTGQLAVATDYIVLEGYSVEVLPSA